MRVRTHASRRADDVEADQVAFVDVLFAEGASEAVATVAAERSHSVYARALQERTRVYTLGRLATPGTELATAVLPHNIQTSLHV